MHALTLKNPSFFRPTSRPTSPPPSRPDSGIGFERSAHPLNRLSLSTFRRASPAPTPTATSTLTPATLVQDGSYLEMLSLKLSEAVSKAFAQPPGPAIANELVCGKRPVPAGRGRALGALIASELQATRDNPHLHRALLRYLHRPLSVLLSNLSAHLLPLVSSPAFLTPPTPTPQAPNPNPTQLHALALAGLAGELLETFDDLGLGMEVDVRGEGLKMIRESLVSLVGRVVNPLVGGIKAELMPLIVALENPISVTGGPAKIHTGSKLAIIQHPSIVALQTMMPIYARALNRHCASTTSQATLASLLISLLWRGLVALANRPYQSVSPPNSPSLPTAVYKGRRESTSMSPPATPPTRFAIKLPPSRPPSPPYAQAVSTVAADARALNDLLNLLPRPVAANKLACEAVDEAFDGLKALTAVLEAAQTNAFAKGTQTQAELDTELEVLTADLPTLISLPIVLRAHVSTSRTVAEMLGIPEDEYRKGCLAGFSRAEECAAAVGQRVLDVLLTNEAPTQANMAVIKWLEVELTNPDD